MSEDDLEFPADPPDGYRDAQPHAVVASAAKAAGASIANMSANEITVLFNVLAPATLKLCWYENRYNAMLKTIRELRAEKRKISNRLRKLEQRTGLGSHDAGASDGPEPGGDE
jgi:hypothetical protein